MYKKIIVFEPNYLGDILMTLPALRLIKQNYPDIPLVNVIPEEFKDAVLNYSDGFIFRGERTINDRIKLTKDVMKEKADLAILFRTSLFDAVVSKLAGIKKRIGLNASCGRLLLTHTMLFNSTTPFYKRYTNLLSTIGIKAEEVSLEYTVGGDDIKKAEELLISSGVSNRNIAIISPGTTRPAKLWNVDNYIPLIKFLKDMGLTIIIVGRENDYKFIKGLFEKCPDVINLVGKTSLGTLAALISKASLVISPDNGTFYLAIALKKNSIGLFGSTDPHLYGPYNKNSLFIYKSNCGPCYKNNCPKGFFPAPCMESIKVNDVIEKVRCLL